MNDTHPSIEHIVEFLHGELSPAEDAAIHAHLAGCSDCERKRSEELAIIEALRRYGQATEREMSARLASKIRTAAAESRPGAWQRLVAGFRPMVMIPAAAAVGLAVYFGYHSWHHATAPTAINAAYYVNNHNAMAASAPFGDAAPPITLTSDNAPR